MILSSDTIYRAIREEEDWIRPSVRRMGKRIRLVRSDIEGIVRGDRS